jgi:hypothetical protein
MQAGAARPPTVNLTLASVWAGSAQSWMNLGGPSGINGIWGKSLVGDIFAPTGHAALWNDPSSTPIDLNPAGAIGSSALAIHGSQQVGTYHPDANTEHACLWTGSAASFVDLNPPGFPRSEAFATDGVHQGGTAQNPAGGGAAMWTGSAQSYVNMQPSWAMGSEILGMWPGEQAGSVTLRSLATHAALWHGSPESAIDLNPAGAGVSRLYATCGSAQVGTANTIQYGFTAGIWFGTPESFVALGQFLPARFGISFATSVAEANGMYYVGGYAQNLDTFQYEAFLWVGTVPGPGAAGALLFAGVWAARRRRG